MVTWSDFAASGLGPELPLTSGQKVQLPSGLLPSGEANYFDFYQAHNSNGSGINFMFPSPLSFVISGVGQSGLYRTYGPDDSLVVADVSGIFHASGV
tara:strand:+ start:457 stop:747 length:291 start_codon:yes stop_codon:yes gene_type:complete